MKSDYVRRTVTWEGKRYVVRGNTEREADKKLGELLSKLKRGEFTIGENSSVDRWYKEWISLYKENSGITKKSLGTYDEKYYGYISPAIGKMKIKDVRDVHLQKILNSQAGMSFSHVSKIRMVMKELFSRARKSRMLLYDPSEDLTLPEVKKESHRAITEEERDHILHVAETHRSGLWILMLLYTGMRPGGTAALLWKDVDFEANEIHIYKAVESGSTEIKDPKTESGFRDIPIRAELRKRLLDAKGDPFAPVFPTQAGNLQNSNSILRLWKSFKRALDIDMGAELYRNKIIRHAVADDLTPYCLRHTFCTDLERAGVPINVAKVLMGHSDISVTANIYTHKDSNVLHAAINQVGVTKPVTPKEEKA